MCLFVENSAPLLSAVLVFAGLSKNATPANIEGRLYCKYRKILNILY
jgi:hypothetical protein